MPRRTLSDRFERLLPEVLCPDCSPNAGRMIVAASGGADSTALLVALHALLKTGRLVGELVACHIDHGLRPELARREEQVLLLEICRSLGVPLLIRRVQVDRNERNERNGNGVRGSLEAAARAARYAALGAVAAEQHAEAVLTAHTAGDQVETLLLRLLRGTGIAGLASIPARSRPWGAGGPLLLRPLLKAWPQETRAYCRAQAVVWSEDETNASSRFARNRVRHELLPLLNALHPGAERSLLRVTAQAGELRAWLDDEVERVLRGCLVRDGERWLLRAPPDELSPFLGRQVMVRVLGDLLGGGGASGARQVEALYACWRGPLGRRCDLGRGWRAESTVEGLRIVRVASGSARNGTAASPAPDRRWRLRPGENRVPGWLVSVAPVEFTPAGAIDRSLVAYVATDAVERLTLRFWCPGDRMRPAGMSGRKKLQDIFVDGRIERSRRHQVPLLFLDGECIWAAGVKRSALAGSVPAGNAGWRIVVREASGA